MELKFNPQTRKELVKAMGIILGEKPRYLGTPSYAFQVGGYHIDRAGMVTGPENLNLTVGLADRGFEPEPSKTFHLITPRGTLLCQERFDTAEEAEAAGYGNYFHHEGRDVYIRPTPNGATEHSKQFAVVGAPFEKPEPMDEAPEPDQPDQVVIEYPLDNMTPEVIDNLTKMVQSKEPLLKKALGVEELPIQMHSDRLAFPWFRLREDNGEVAAYSQFIAALCETAKEKKRVNAKPQDNWENEKFALRVWLIGLGLVGKEYGKIRKLLVNDRLSGNGAWRYGAPEKAPVAPVEATEEIAAGDGFPGEAEAPNAETEEVAIDD